MHIYNDMNEWRRVRQTLATDCSVGFVPTMGNLHLGHASLFSSSIKENDYTVASIFINPTQFNQRDDFKQYPRTLDDDLELLAKTGVDYCILPNEETIYSDHYRYQIDETSYSNQMEHHSSTRARVRRGHLHAQQFPDHFANPKNCQ